MENNSTSEEHFEKNDRTLRLTFQVKNSEVKMVSLEQLEMICPPSFGDKPEIGKHSDFWMELCDSDDKVLFFRHIHEPIGNSVTVHSADGKIHREFGEGNESIFEVLVPEHDKAASILLIGESLKAGSEREMITGGSKELARFDIELDKKGGKL
ncbi:MAG: hypothetical protein ACI8ZM_004691 [Crocinitomix sp.]|jgi:hypothetical protein